MDLGAYGGHAPCLTLAIARHMMRMTRALPGFTALAGATLSGRGYTGDVVMDQCVGGDVQAMIDYLAESGDGQPGEVWIAAGTYEPQSQLIQGRATRPRSACATASASTAALPAQSILRASVTVKKEDGGMPWEFENETVPHGRTL